eukprot:CAMPEP_0113690342 /NCGR_PEP_ID=MMETSP0038_2-20120614/17725_1 /TAXON_ID=2898 /ORGANISM="Cryptomonas paramecium" /LENGTH=234 /DNA_ID=CAMNT_0000611631 /DNA_START=45 /DNA_END=749 /DNA_ORIENTATION=+ /assembly_acc=CAM_ASM_000170
MHSIDLFGLEKERLREASIHAMEGCQSALEIPGCANSFEGLVAMLDQLFASEVDWVERQRAILGMLRGLKLSSKEITKYVDWQGDSPYTRNLVASDGKNYSLLVLCWKPGRESRIHNHPCQGCFVRVLCGSLVETLYSVHPEIDEIREITARVANAGSVSFMNDDLGLHKIGAENNACGAVSLHLYTPPFSSCKVWSSSGQGQLANFQEGLVEFSDHASDMPYPSNDIEAEYYI